MYRDKSRFELPWPFDKTVAAVYRHLSDITDSLNSVLSFEWEQVSQSSVVCKLKYLVPYPGGDSLGRFELFELPNGNTAIERTGPPLPHTRPFNEREGKILDSIPPGSKEYAKKVGLLIREIDKEAREIQKQQADRQSRILRELLKCLGWEPALSRLAGEPVDDAKRDSGHYAHSAEKRKEIVKEHREARGKGQVSNKNAWAQSHYQISGRTLLNYEKEFPEET
jgi:hypothetical protein